MYASRVATLTEKQAAIIGFIAKYRNHHGVSPTQVEIKTHFEYRSLGTVSRHLGRLEEKGVLGRLPNQKRGITLAGEASYAERAALWVRSNYGADASARFVAEVRV